MKRPAKVEEVVGVACMVVLVLLTLGNVLSRYFTDASFALTEEISIFLIVVMTLAGAVFDRTGHYTPVLWGCVVLAALATAAASRLIRPQGPSY